MGFCYGRAKGIQRRVQRAGKSWRTIAAAKSL
jgi:hypothetical protein